MDNFVFVTSNTCNASKRHKSQRLMSKARIKARSRIPKRSDSVSTKKRKAETQEKIGAEPKSPQVEVPLQVPMPDGEKNKPRDGVEKVLEQLVSSLTRVEDRISSVEEHVKNPTSSIEARLKEIEQQLEKIMSLENNPSAPGFSFRKSDDHDHDHDHFTTNKQSNVFGSDGFKCGENADCSSSTQTGFIVTAPEFLDNDDVASPGSNCVVDKCETVNNFPENHVNGGVESFDTNGSSGLGKRRYAKISRIFTCFNFYGGTKNPGCTY